MNIKEKHRESLRKAGFEIIPKQHSYHYWSQWRRQQGTDIPNPWTRNPEQKPPEPEPPKDWSALALVVFWVFLAVVMIILNSVR